MRRALAGMLLLLLGPGGDALAWAQAPVERTPTSYVVRVRAPFPEVMLLLQEAIKRRNYTVTGINHVDDTLALRATEVGAAVLPYEHYKVVGFCNLTLADAAVRETPYAGAFMPCRAVVFQARGAQETVVVVVRPSWLLRAVEGGLERIVEQAEQDVLEILTDLAAD